MAVAALILYGISLALTFGVRIAVQFHRTDSTGVHGLPPDASPVELVRRGPLRRLPGDGSAW